MKIKSNYIYLTVILLLVFLIGYMSQCKGKETVIIEPDSIHDSLYKSEQKENAIIQATIKELSVLKAKNDSLEKLKPKVVHHYHTVYDSLIVADTSCIGSLITLYNTFGELNDLNDTIIANSKRRAEKDSILIASGNNKLATKQCRITNDSTYIDYLVKDSIPKVAKKGFWKGYGKGFRHGTAFGVAADESARAGIRMIKP